MSYVMKRFFNVYFVFQGQTFPAVLNDSGLTGQPGTTGQQVILVSHQSQSANGATDNGYTVSIFVLLASPIQGKSSKSACQLMFIPSPLCIVSSLSLCVLQISTDKGGKELQVDTDNRNQCFYCNQVCQNANTLRRHCRQAHGKDRCHVCSLCRKAFKRATHLKVRTYTDTAC